MTKRIAVKDLHADSIDAVSIRVSDWSEVFQDFESEDGGHFWEAQTCETCGHIHVFENGGGNEKHNDIDSDSECEGYFGASEGPMMNYWYPVDSYNFSPSEAAEAIADLPLCVVEVNGQYGLALTGGGMDLSWEICEAYTRIGELPPVKFCDLPRMAGRGESARDKYIVSACRASLRIQMIRATSMIKRLRNVA